MMERTNSALSPSLITEIGMRLDSRLNLWLNSKYWETSLRLSQEMIARVEKYLLEMRMTLINTQREALGQSMEINTFDWLSKAIEKKISKAF